MNLRKYHSNRVDNLRGIAVLLVVGVHTSQIIGNGDETSKWYVAQSKLFLDFGARGVQIFFIISAYGIAASYSRNFSSQIKSYYLRRFFRIYPVWVIAVLVHSVIQNKTDRIGENVSFAFGWLRANENNPEIVGGSWTLFIEVIFYLIFPLVYPAVRHTRILVIMLLSLIILRISWLRFAEDLFGFKDYNSFIGLHPFSNFYCFIIGLLIFNLKIRRCILNINLAPITIIFLFVSIYVQLDQVIQVLLIGVIIYEYLKKETYEAINEKIKLLNTSIRLLGKYAFTIYLYHLIFLYKMEETLGTFSSQFAYVETKFFFSFLIALVILFLIGWLGYSLVEKPSIKIGHFFNSRLPLNKGETHVQS